MKLRGRHVADIAAEGQNAEDVFFGYDNQGRLLSALFNGGTGVTQTYDGLGRMDTRTVFGRQLSYQYDLRGRRTRLTHPDGFFVTYGYSNVDELVSLTENSSGPTVVSFGYDGLGVRTSVTRPNGASTSYVPDAMERLQQLTQDLSGTGFDLTETFLYNPAGQIASKTSNNDAAYTPWPSPPNTTTNAQFDGQNQLTSFAGAPVTEDANRDVWTGLGSLAYVHDALGQLRTASGGGNSAQVDYDPTGMLRRVTVGSTTTEYLYDGADLVAEYNGSTVLRRFVHGVSDDEPLVAYEGSGTTNKSWLHSDERGSIIAASDASGVAASSVKYTADGDSASLASPFGYTGQLYLPELQLYYYKARMYSPKAGRFLQPDPIGYSGGMNLYGYAGNDPANFRDPSGLCELWDSKFWDGVTLTVTQHGIYECLRELQGELAQEVAGMFGLSPPSADSSGSTNNGGSAQATSQDQEGLFRKAARAFCKAPALTAGLQLQLNYGFLRIFGAEGQVSLSSTSHGQVIWTQSAGGVAGINQGLVLKGAVQGGWITEDAPAGFSTYSTLGGEIIEAEAEGLGVGVAESTDESAVGVDLAGLGFAVGGGLVAGADYQRGLAVATPSLCSLLE